MNNNVAFSLTIPVLLFQLIQTNKLKHYPSIHGDFSSEFRQPCVVFTGHPSLRFGDVVHFMELWGKSSLNTIIFTGNYNCSVQALSIYYTLDMDEEIVIL